MKVSGNAVMNAGVGPVYEALTDPRTLAAAIPGCERLELIGPDVYDMVVTVGVGAIKGTYKGRVELADREEPRSFTLRASGAGAPGTVSAECRMLLVYEAAERTRVEYDADAVVGGVVGGVGQRMLGGVARKLAGQFFTGMDEVLARGPAGEVPGELVPEAVPALPETTRSSRSGAGSAHGGPVVAPAPVPVPASVPAPRATPGAAVVMAASFTGAVAALSGVVLGWAMGRSRGRRGRR